MSIPGKEVSADMTVKTDGHNGSGTGTMTADVMVESTVPPKKKRKTSKGLKNLDKAHRNVSRAMDHMAAAVSDGMKTYRKNEKKSAEKKKDGALRDMVKNTGKAVSDTMKTMSKVPRDLTRTIDSKRNRKQVRSVARFLSGPVGR
ncbi:MULTISPECIES: hypothetical protein [Corallococcus]|uniref:DUF6312 domain-containing protein n=1 Tax=Corallococcus TaxID=83461 RepID=UPI00117E6E38|nr:MULTISPECIES: hypothetical protein [Corallococcus]NBD08313.1 hypothetical protein [Corallococcus silvisoli]TSC34271.1 hypothetical protein FOF48_04350 [Corallococcus sp. Z5C101001]